MKHKRIFCLLCVLVLCFAAFPTALAEQPSETGAGNGATPTNWMSYLYDGLLMNRINIPGTHDSGTKYVDAGQCQNIPINEQLDMGVRFLDMRVGVRWKNENGKKKHYLQVYHGNFDAKLSYDQVLDWCVSFLTAHPSEFIVMSVKEDPDPQGGSEYSTAQMVEQYIDKYDNKHPGLFQTQNSIRRVKDIRGKIVLIRRYNNGNLEPIGIDARSNWPNDSYGIYNNGTYCIDDHGLHQDIRLAVQDCYSFGSSGCEEEKWYCWRKWRGKAEEEERPVNKWAGYTLWINFGSGCNKLGLAIEAIANYVNPRIKSSFENLYNSGSIRGIIPMDYVKSDVVQAIYKSNRLTRNAQESPSVYGVGETVDGKNDGELHLMDGYTNTGRIEYRLSGVTAPGRWYDWPADKMEITELAPGVYDVRNKGNEEYTESATVQVVVRTGAEKTYAVAVTGFVSSPDANKPFAPLTYLYNTVNTVTYTLKNVGNSTVENLRVWRTGDSEFTCSEPVLKTLPAGASTTMVVTFQGGVRDVGEYTCALQYGCDGCAVSAIPLANISQTVKPFDLESDGAKIDGIHAEKYTGNPITPRFTVEVEANSSHSSDILTKDMDYTVGYYDNSKVGTAYVTAYGKGNFTGILTKDFQITGSKVTLDAKDGLIDGGHIKEFQNRSDIPPLENNVPYYSGHSFLGWYYDTTYAKPAKSYEEVLKDTTLVAKWGTGNYTLSVSPATKDFGSCESGYADPPAAETFTLTNTGSSDISGFSITDAEGNFNIVYTSVGIAPGGTVRFTVQPKAGLSEGVYSDTIAVYTTHSSSAALTLSVTFTVTPSTLFISPETADFGAVEPGYQNRPDKQTIDIVYAGESTTKVITLQQPTGAADYEIISYPANTTLDADNRTATFTVQPKAGLAENVYNETITVTGTINDSGTKSLKGALMALKSLIWNTDNSVSLTMEVEFAVSSSIQKPVITSDPADVTVSAGSNATFTVAATGNPTPSFQWQQQAPNSTTWVDLPCRETTYTTDRLSAAKHGTKYRCHVWNYTSQKNDVYTKEATVSVNSLSITPAGMFCIGEAPANLTLHIGQAGQTPSTGDWGNLAIVLDGEPAATPVNPKAYDVTYGSIHLTLHQDWLNTLPVGTHLLQVTLTGHYAGTPVLTIPLTVTAPGSSGGVPMTGDTARPWLWLGMMLLSGVGLIASAARRRRKRKVY